MTRAMPVRDTMNLDPVNRGTADVGGAGEAGDGAAATTPDQRRKLEHRKRPDLRNNLDCRANRTMRSMIGLKEQKASWIELMKRAVRPTASESRKATKIVHRKVGGADAGAGAAAGEAKVLAKLTATIGPERLAPSRPTKFRPSEYRLMIRRTTTSAMTKAALRRPMAPRKPMMICNQRRLPRATFRTGAKSSASSSPETWNPVPARHAAADSSAVGIRAVKIEAMDDRESATAAGDRKWPAVGQAAAEAVLRYRRRHPLIHRRPTHRAVVSPRTPAPP